jgi:hypothetical protein
MHRPKSCEPAPPDDDWQSSIDSGAERQTMQADELFGQKDIER